MRFQISYHGGTTHEVELPGSVCVVGRDPGCDIVLNDSKCSRRHAVIEDGPAGLSIRDAGSANGIFVNGRRVERAPLKPGDNVKLGEVQLRLLPEIGETVVVAPEGLELETADRGPSELGDSQPGPEPAALRLPTPPPASAHPRRPTTPRAPAAPVPRPVRRVPQALGRPATVSLLAGLWALFVPLAIAGTLVGAARLQAGWLGWLGAGLLAAVAAGLGTSMALGLRALAPWARHLQIASAAVALLVCPFTLAAATVLLYMARPEVKGAFEGTTPALGGPTPESAEPTFALSLVGLLLLGLALTAIAVLVL